MDDFIGNNVKFIADWGQLVMCGIIGLATYLIFLIVRKNRYYLPKSFLGYLGSITLFLIILLSTLIVVRITIVKPGVMAIINQLESVKGQKTPTLNFQMVSDNSAHNIEDYRGNVVLLNFWATWCAPCLREMPDLNKLQTDYSDQGLKVIVISDESRKKLNKFAVKFPFQVSSGYTDSFTWANLASERPATFLINQEGIVVDYFTGSYDYEFFESQVLKYLGKPKSTK